MNKIFVWLCSLTMSTIMMIGLGVTGFYYFSLYDDGSSIDANLVSVERSLKDEEKKKKDTDQNLGYAREMQERVGKLSQVYQDISRRLPATLYSVQLNKDIEGFAARAGVTVKFKTPGTNLTRGIIEEVPYQVTLEGDFLQIAQFVYFVSTAERMARVQNIKVSDSDQGHKKLKFEAQVVAYKLAPEQKKSSDASDRRTMKSPRSSSGGEDL